MDKRKENIIFAFICVLCVLLCTLLFVLSCCKIYKMDSKLKDKRAIILGDSVARGAVDNGGSELWSKEIEKNIGLLIDNEAVSGTAAGLCDGYGDFSLCEIVNWKPFEKYDICFIAYGTLDYIYQMEIGEPDYLSLNTFYGSYNYSIQKILQVNSCPIPPYLDLGFLIILIIIIRKANVKNAPGARIIIKVFGKNSNKSAPKPKTVPFPKNSRTIPIAVSATVKPKPIPIPSNIESKGLFFDAKASARASIIQFTTISGIKSPRDLSRLGTNAFKIICTIVTKLAITTINAGILI